MDNKVKNNRLCVVCGEEISRAYYQSPPEKTVCSRSCGALMNNQIKREKKTRKKSSNRFILNGYWALPVGGLVIEDRHLLGADYSLPYVYEHRLIVARQEHRPLSRADTVLHINHNKLDNRPENLALRAHKELDPDELNKQYVKLKLENYRLKQIISILFAYLSKTP